MLVKFCGMTRAQDVALACELEVDAVGFVLWPQSPRAIALRDAAALIETLPEKVVPVGVFVSPLPEEVAAAVEAGIRVAQVHGYYDATHPADITQPTYQTHQTHQAHQAYQACRTQVVYWLAASIESDLAAIPFGTTLVLDAYDPEKHGGTGRTTDWAWAATVAAQRPVILAGGLSPENVGTAIRQVRPQGVDVASGIEDRPGVKNAAAMRAFITAAREADR